VNAVNAVVHRLRSLAAALRSAVSRTPAELPVDPFGEPPRAPHDPHAYRSEAWKAPSPSTLNFH
jgi:hypothetical protein